MRRRNFISFLVYRVLYSFILVSLIGDCDHLSRAPAEQEKITLCSIVPSPSCTPNKKCGRGCGGPSFPPFPLLKKKGRSRRTISLALAWMASDCHCCRYWSSFTFLLTCVSENCQRYQNYSSRVHPAGLRSPYCLASRLIRLHTRGATAGKKIER